MTANGARVEWAWKYPLLLCALVVCLAGCSLGDILTSGPPAYEITDAEVIGTWAYEDGPGSFVFAADKTFTMTGVPADMVMINPQPGGRADGWGDWEIGAPQDGLSDKPSAVQIGVHIGGQFGSGAFELTAYKPHRTVQLCGRGHCFTRQA